MLAVQKYSVVKVFEELNVDPSILSFKNYSSFGIFAHNFLSKLPRSVKYKIDEGSRIELSDYPYFFEILKRKSGYFGNYKIEINFSPGSESLNSYVVLDFDTRENKFSWKTVYPYVKLWARLSSNELLSISYLEKVMKQVEKLNENNETEDYAGEDEFSNDERVRVVEKIALLQRGVRHELNLDDYKLNLILSKLEDLKEKVDTQSKFDFKSSLYGLVINLTSSVLYDNSNKFMDLFRSIFNSSFLK